MLLKATNYQQNGKALRMPSSSAAQESDRLSLKATRLAAAASTAAVAAKNFQKGAEGESLTAQALAPLSAEGVFLLHDRRVPGVSGNVDHIVVGLFGVVVINAKAWTNARFSKGKLYSGTTTAGKALTRLQEEEEGVRGILEKDACVSSALLFTEGFTGDSGSTTALALDALVPYLRALPVCLSQKQVEDAAATLLAKTFTASAPTPPPDEDTFDKTSPVSFVKMSNVFNEFFVKDWHNYGHHRLYLYGRTGSLQGVKDVKAGTVKMEETKYLPKTSEKFLETVSSPLDLPKVRITSIPLGGPLLSGLFSNASVVVLVGWVWKRNGVERLYVHALRHKKDSVEVGYIDLNSGETSVKTKEALHKVDPKHILLYTWLRYVNGLKTT